MTDTTQSLSERLFASQAPENELVELLSEAGAEFERLGWDDYDNSLELHGVQDAWRASEAVQRVVHGAGFATLYVNHTDKWETHYSFKKGPFVEVKGWRVQYPHKAGGTVILVEEFPASWPQQWLETGYVVVKAP